MVQVIGLMKRDYIMLFKMLMIIGQNLLIIIYGDEIEIIKITIMIMVIINILDSDHVQEVIMYLVYENGISYCDYL
jgi:hypothetical protein